MTPDFLTLGDWSQCKKLEVNEEVNKKLLYSLEILKTLQQAAQLISRTHDELLGSWKVEC